MFQNKSLFAALILNVAFAISDADKVVQIKDGLVLGSEFNTKGLNKTCIAFRGIPFAEAPVGDLRFKPPQPVKPWMGIFNATKEGNMCVQGFTNVIGSEDCLFINVYTPNISSNEDSLLPVMVWIYGGAFIGGDSTYETYGPDYLLEEDVIVVSFNYRLGIFGFLSTEDEVSPGNYGLKDQILALQWVQDNIKYFGGNPNQVTVFGESAGSASVSYLLQIPLTKGLFQRAIMQSGTSLCLWSLARESRNIAFAAGLVLNINTTNSETLVESLRQVNYTVLQSVSTVTDLAGLIWYNPANGLIFAPTIEPPHEGAVLTNKSHELIRRGEFNHVPLIIGFNSQEGIPFAQVIKDLRLYLASYDVMPTRLVPIDMNINNKEDSSIKKDVASLIKTHYFGLLGSVALSDSDIVYYISDDQFVRPIDESARIYSQYTPTYFYKFSYEGILGSVNRTEPGVGHGEDLNYIWYHNLNGLAVPQGDALTRNRLVRMWTNFAKTSNPTPQADPLLQNVIWPYNINYSDGLNYLNIGADLKVESDPNEETIKFWRSIYSIYGKPPYDTY